MRSALIAVAVLVVAIMFFLTRAPPRAPAGPVDRYRIAEERLEAERARGRLSRAELERIRLAIRAVRDGIDTPRLKVIRGETLKSATTEISACRVTVLTPWLDEAVGVAECNFEPLAPSSPTDR